MSDIVEVSIIIPSFNSMDTLPKAIRSIEEVEYPIDKFEVIVVDDGSTDGTREFIERFIEETKLNLIYLGQENAGPAAARNTGIGKAQGEYILFLDSDSFVDKNILSCYIKHFPKTGLGGVGGDVVPIEHNSIIRYLDCYGVWRPGKNSSNEIMYLVTANAFFLRKAVIEAGNFDENFLSPGGEEPELCYRIRKNSYHFQYDEKAQVMHLHQNTVRDMMKMSFNHGKGAAIFFKKWPESDEKIFLWRIILGTGSLKWAWTKAARKVGLPTVIKYFLLDYIRKWACYFGYRSIMKLS